MKRALITFAWLAASAACGHPPAEDALTWAADDRFMMRRDSVFARLDRAVSGDAATPARMQAALDHNCPLELVEVRLEPRPGAASDGAASYVLDVCGLTRTYRADATHAFLEVTTPAASTGEPISNENSNENPTGAPSSPLPAASAITSGKPAPVSTPAPKGKPQ